MEEREDTNDLLGSALRAAINDDLSPEGFLRERDGLRRFRSRGSRRERLMEAIGRNDFHGARELLEGKRMNLNFADRRGETPLGAAIDNGSLAMFQLLLEQGADPNFGNPKHALGFPLPFILYSDRVELLRVAVRHGAEPRREPNLFDLAFERQAHLCAAYLYGLDGMLQRFEESEAFQADAEAAMRFLRAAQISAALDAGDHETFDALLAQGGYDEAARPRFLYAAIRRSEGRFLEHLLQAGASVESPYAGLSPLDLTLNLKNQRAFEMLLRNGATPDESVRAKAAALGWTSEV